ncbi:hypothetical protein C7974DRAFT_418232 [Boeremia exigua]|uniref:uncharacterized protein n=1 Tax=Boeremia exigua TaxID=749465 RepID=UPI001E8CF115|nr:uncharacterized protein C7974DRAFT_418232 [Boeremia exigua]KAH6613145.1 hypothetical protein C7974DRAFT_418232 [Boeremia exigua]
MTGPDTPDNVVQSLAQHLDDAGDTRAALRKVWLTHLEYLMPLRSVASDADLESFHTVCAWYLTPNYLLRYEQELAARDVDVINSSRRIAAISRLVEVWGATAILKIRQGLRDQLPLPTVPNRDFLVELSKIATARYHLRAFLQDLPPFIAGRIHTWRAQDPRYENHEKRPCLQFKHLKAFYQDKYVPEFLQTGKAILAAEPPAKRQKTGANTRVTRTVRSTSAPDKGAEASGSVEVGVFRPDDVEIPRRADTPERQVNDSVIPNSSPAPSTDLSEQSNEACARHSDTLLPIDNTVCENPELPISNDPSFADEPGEGSLISEDNPTRIEPGVNTMPRTGKQPSEAMRASKDVQEKFNDFVQQFGMNPALQWLIETARQREALRVQGKAANEAYTAAEDAVSRLEESIQAELLPGKTLSEAMTDAHEDLQITEDVYNRLMSLGKAAQELLPDVASAGLQGSAQIQFKVNESSAASVRAARAQRVKDLADFADELQEKEEDRTRKEEEADRLEEEYAQINAKQEKLRGLFNMRHDQPTLAALAKLPLPSDLGAVSMDMTARSMALKAAPAKFATELVEGLQRLCPPARAVAAAPAPAPDEPLGTTLPMNASQTPIR